MILAPKRLAGLLLLCALAASAANPAPFSAKNYLDLEAWSRANRLQIFWLKRNSELLLVNQQHRFHCTVDSRKADLDGVSVWLSEPIALRAKRPQIAPIDIQMLLQPLLFPVKTAANHRVRTIALDSGHGGKDPGNEAQEGKFQEKKFTLLLAGDVGKQLEEAGFKVVLTRPTDAFVELPDRPKLAERAHADLFISLHFNSAPPIRSPVSGVEIYCLTPPGALSTNLKGDTPNSTVFPGNRANAQNVLLAYEIQKAIVHRLPVEDRGVRRARLAVLRTAEMPAVLIEAGFMSAPSELKKIADPTYRHRMAAAIAEGIQGYVRLVQD